AVIRRTIEARAIGALGRAALAAGASRVLVGRVHGEARVLGAFERRVAGAVRRVSGGPSVLVGEGTVHLTIAMPRHDAIDRTCDAPAKLLNRYVRPLLRALGPAR